MTWVSTGSASITSGSSAFNISHAVGGSHDGQRSVLAIVTQDTISVSSINEFPGAAPGGWTLNSSSAAQGRKWWLYDKICGPTEAGTYAVTLSAVVNSLTVAFLVDFATSGDAIRAAGYANGGAGGTSITLPSLSAARADDLYAFAWSEDAAGEQLHGDAPLTRVGSGTTQGGWHAESARQVWQSSSATGTRTYTMTAAGTYDKAIGAMILVGDIDPQPLGGWGVGQVRMGTN
jgi:hypothetical protein